MTDRSEPAWCDAFRSLVARKTHAAVAAVTPPYTTEIDAPRGALVAVGNSWSERLFDGAFYVSPPAASRPACSLVFVQSAEGNTVASDPATLGGGVTDQHIVYEGLSRVAADAVLVGASTMRGGGGIFSVWHPALVDLRQALSLPRHPVQLVATLGGVDIERGLLFNVPDIAVVVVTAPEGAALMQRPVADRPWIRMVTMPRADRLGEVFPTLRELGISRISCVGGRSLANQLLMLDLIDDVYLTTSPRPGGDADTSLNLDSSAAAVIVRKRGTAEESGVRFEHFHLR